MASAARGRPPRPGPTAAAAVQDDIRKLQAEILTGLDSSEEEAPGARSASPEQAGDGVVALTERAILLATGEESVEDVTQLIFRDRQLRCLVTPPRSIDLERLVNLEVLSLSHNLLEDIEPLGMLFSLVEVNLNFNRITDLSPLHDCELLEKLFVSHNKVQSIDGLDVGCPRLRELALFSNSLDEHDELMETLRALPALRDLHLGENPCCGAPSQRYRLLCELASLEVFDGQKVGLNDRKFAAAFLEAASKDDGPAVVDVQPEINLPRPVTAPSVCTRPPLAPLQKNAGPSVSLTPLPGQRLRSSRANKIDDLLTQSREPSPDIVESRIPALDLETINLDQPDRALTSLSAHYVALQQCLDTMKIDRENLRFQLRLLEQDKVAQHSDKLRADVERLEVENRSSQAVQSEHTQLQARLAEVEKKLSGTGQRAVLPSKAPVDNVDTVADDDTMSELRWENQLLQKRLDRMKKYSDQSRHTFLCAQVSSKKEQSSLQDPDVVKAGGKVKLQDSEPVDTELSAMLADNEAMLRRLTTAVSQTAAGQPPKSSVHSGLVNDVRRGAQVDVLTIAGEGAEDVEYHGKASP